MITEARLTEDIKPAGLDWITALRAPAIKQLVQGRRLAAVAVRRTRHGQHHQPRLPRRAPDCLPQSRTAAERTRKRQDCWPPPNATWPYPGRRRRKRDPLRGSAEIGMAVGAVIDTHKMRKHFDLDITDTSFGFARKTDAIAAEAATDGLYIVRTSLTAEVLDDAATVRSYKSLSQVERAFRCIKTVDLVGRCITGWPIGFARIMSSCACSPTIWNGICARRWRRCCSTTPTRRPPRRHAGAWSPRRNVRRGQFASRPPT